MIQYEKIPTKQNNTSVTDSWWTPDRVRLAGFAGFIGSSLLAVTIIILTAFGISDSDVIWAISPVLAVLVDALHIIPYLLMAVLLSVTGARYGGALGRFGRAIGILLGIAIVGTAIGLLLAIYIAPTWMPGIIMVGVSFVAMHVLGTVFGAVLWRRTTVSRLAAGLLTLTIFMVAPAIAFDLAAAYIETPLALGFAILGYQFWKDSDSTTTTDLSGISPHSA